MKSVCMRERRERERLRGGERKQRRKLTGCRKTEQKGRG